MPRFQRWGPDTCDCRNLYQVIEDDGSFRMASVLEVRQMHTDEYQAWADALALLGLTPADVQNRSSAWETALKAARRTERLTGTPAPSVLTNGVVDPASYEQEPHEICRVHFEMGHPEDDDESDEAITKRGAILAENVTKNDALRAIVEVLGTPDEEHGAVLEAVKWSFAPPDKGERAVRIELPQAAKAVQAQIETKIAEKGRGAVAIVDSVDAERANDIALGVSEAFTRTP